MQQASQWLLELLDAHVCVDDAEEASVTLARHMIMQHTDIWLQSCEAGHITGSGLILDREDRKVLLLHHRKLQLWLQMGGHGEDEFDPAQTAFREAVEESGLTDLAFFPDRERPMLIDIDTHVIPARNEQSEHYHIDFRYLFSTSSPEKVRLLQTEAKDVRWFTFSELAMLCLRPATLRLIQKAEKLLKPSYYS